MPAEPTAITRRFDRPDELREFSLGSYRVIEIGGMTLGLAEYQPGWRWSAHVGADRGQRLCEVAHLGYVLSGRNRVEMEDGRIVDLGPGDLFEIGPGHDSWVVGDEPYVSLHFLGAADYAAR